MIGFTLTLTLTLKETEDQFKQFASDLEKQNLEPHKNPLIQQIDQWEQQSIKKIRQVAEDIRNKFSPAVISYVPQLPLQLKHLKDRLIQCREEKDFLDNDIHFFNGELNRLKNMLYNPSCLQLQDTGVALVNAVRLTTPTVPAPVPQKPPINSSQKWTQNAITVAGGNGKGSAMGQISTPRSMCLDDDHTLYVADTINNRIVAWKPGEITGHVAAGGIGQGSRPDQFNIPTDVIIDRHTDSLIIADRENKRVVRWPRRNGSEGETIISPVQCWGVATDNERSLYVVDHDKGEVRRYRPGQSMSAVVAGGHGSDNRLDQLNGPRYVCTDQNKSVYVSDCKKNRVMKWVSDAREGVVVAGGRGAGEALSQFSSPNGIVVDELGSLYVADSRNSRIMRWNKGATEGTVVVGGNGRGDRANQLSEPTDLSFDREGNLYVVDHGNSRVQRFGIYRS